MSRIIAATVAYHWDWIHAPETTLERERREANARELRKWRRERRKLLRDLSGRATTRV